MEVDEDVSIPGELLPTPWQYGMRREMQEILPSIFLGPYQCASKSQLMNLKSHGITHILCVRQDIEARCVKVNFPQDFIYKVIEMRDHPIESIITKFPEARDFIKLALGGGGRILIHGVNGMSRSAALLTAYVMESFELTYEQAILIVKRRRCCVAVNHGFKNQLIEYEPIYRARNSMVQSDVRPGVSLKRRASDEGCDLNLNVKKH